MPKRTFKGFLQSYCRELAGVTTSSKRKLLASALDDAPRVAEPLFLLAVECGELDYLLRLSKGTRLAEEYGRLADEARPYEGDARRYLAESSAPSRYKAVGQAFEGQWNMLRSGRRLADKLRDRTLAYLAQSGRSAYRLFEDSGVNRGNGYAYLFHGDVSKVSYETARSLFDQARRYVEVGTA